MKLIVGLGNPGKEYELTHHNVGFMALDKVANSFNIEFKKTLKFNCDLAELIYNNDKVLFCKPLTFMNNSGESVYKISQFYKIDSSDILVIHDDLDLPLAKLRIRHNGSSGGHNGIKSIINHLHSEEFPRIRIGIDNPNKHSESGVIDYVLSKFSKTDLDLLNKTLDIMPNIIKDYLENDINYIMNHYNKRD